MYHYLDEIRLIQARMEARDASKILWQEELSEWESMSLEQRIDELHDICQRPLHHFTVINRWYFRLKWIGIYEHFFEGKKGVKVVEIGSGESDNIPSSLAKFTDTATYISVNMNDNLSDGLLQKTSRLPLMTKLIRDNAIQIHNHLSKDTIDMVAFEHSVNDILQAMLASKMGMDTVSTDWFDLLPQMIKWMNSEYEAETLQKNLKEKFLMLLENCFSVLKPGGIMVFSHYMFQYDLDLGYHPTLWEDMLPMVRPWINEIKGGREILLKGYDSQWWMFYQKTI